MLALRSCFKDVFVPAFSVRFRVEGFRVGCFGFGLKP